MHVVCMHLEAIERPVVAFLRACVFEGKSILKVTAPSL